MADKSFFRHIQGKIKIKNDKIYIITEFGHKIELNPKLAWLRIDTVTEYDEPFKKTGAIEWNVVTDYKRIDVKQVTKSKKEIGEMIKGRDVIPPTLDYDYFHIGFVFPPPGVEDSNKYRWWLNFNKNEKSVYDMFCDELDIQVPITTESWPDKSGAPIFHGRFKVQKSDVKEIKETEPMKLKIFGNAKKRPITNPGCMSTNIETIKIFYDVKKDFWHVIDQDHKKNAINDKHFKSLAIKQIPMKGIADRSFQKPRVSFEIINHIIQKKEEIGDLLIIE